MADIPPGYERVQGGFRRLNKGEKPRATDWDSESEYESTEDTAEIGKYDDEYDESYSSQFPGFASPFYSRTGTTQDMDTPRRGPPPPSTPRPETWNPLIDPVTPYQERTRKIGTESLASPDTYHATPLTGRMRQQQPRQGGLASPKAPSGIVAAALSASKGNVDEAVASLYSRGFRM
jgi:hypothetical protein